METAGGIIAGTDAKSRNTKGKMPNHNPSKSVRLRFW
jgi:hypothetical protein